METTQKTDVPVINYTPYKDRTCDFEYQNALLRIVNGGVDRIAQFHGNTKVRKRFVNTMEFEMKNGFPMITDRKLETKDGDSEKMMRYAIAEIIGFIHGATTLAELEKFGLPKYWWKRWTALEHVSDKNGNHYFDLPKKDGEQLGRFSYGGIWGKFPIFEENIFSMIWSFITGKPRTINQWERVIKQMVKSPTAFTHRVTNWYPPGIINPYGKRQVVVAPCHGDVQIELDPQKRILTLIHSQRAADVPVGVPYNMIHYPAIGMMLACVLGYTFTDYKHVMNDSHIYVDKQMNNVEELIKRSALRLPTVTLDFKPTGDPVKDFFNIRPEHFHLSDYHAHPGMRIDTEL